MDTSTLTAIIIFVVLSAIVIGLIFLLSKKKKPANQFTLMPITPVNKDIKVESIDKKEEIKEEKEEVKTEEIKEDVKEKVEEPVKEEESTEEYEPSPIIDIPIKDMDDTPITIEEDKSLVEENQDEMVKIEESKPLKENKGNGEYINVKEESVEKTEEPIKEEIKEEPQPEEEKEDIKIEEIKEDKVETELIQPETVQTELIQPDVVQTELIQSDEPQEVVMIDSAFNQKPDDNHDINTNFKVEDKHEYVGNKTEILDVEEIKRAVGSKE